MSPRSLRIIATVGHGRHQLRTAAAPSASAGRVFLHEAQDSSCQLSPDLQNPILVSWNWNCNLGVFAGGRSMHALGCGRTPFIFFVTRGFDKLYARLLRFRPSKLDNRYPGSSLSFFYNKMQFSQSTTVHSRHLQVFRKGEPSRNTASWRTTASKEGRAWAVGWQDRGRKDTERGERRETEEGQRNVIFTFFCPVSLASFQAFLSGRFSTSSASVPTDGPRMVRLETGKPCILCLSEALLLNGWELPRRRVAPGGRRSRWAVSWWRGWPTCWCASQPAVLLCGFSLFPFPALNRQSTEQEKWRTLMAFRAKLAKQPQLPDSEAAASWKKRACLPSAINRINDLKGHTWWLGCNALRGIYARPLALDGMISPYLSFVPM